MLFQFLDGSCNSFGGMAQLVLRMGCHEGCPEHGMIFCHGRVADGGDIDVLLAQGSGGLECQFFIVEDNRHNGGFAV